MVMWHVESTHILEMTNHQHQKVGFVEIHKDSSCIGCGDQLPWGKAWSSDQDWIFYLKTDLTRGAESQAELNKSARDPTEKIRIHEDTEDTLASTADP